MCLRYRPLIPLVVACLIVYPLHAASAQDLQYRPTTDTLRYEANNEYLLYFVQAGDTLGQPIGTETIELHYITEAGRDLGLWVSLKGTDGSFSSESNYTVSRSGRVLEVDGIPVAEVPGARVDVLPRFPDSPSEFTVGAHWSDLVAAAEERPYGKTYYEVDREYRVVAMADSLGATIARIVGEGEMRLRQGGWQDSTAGTVWWQEVAGAIADTIWFDVAAGHLLKSVGAMDLSGEGGAGAPGEGVVLPSGLHSVVRREIR